MLTDSDKKTFAFIRNRIIHFGETPTYREINEFTGKTSPRSASLVIERLREAGLLRKVGGRLKLRDPDFELKDSVATVDIPLVGCVACGVPILAEENIETYIPVSTALAKKGSKYFLLRAVGNSMDRAGIRDKDILLIRQQNDANSGDRVVALINDEATVKHYERTADAVILRPKTSEPRHKPIVLTTNCEIQGVVVAVLPPDLY